MHRRSFLATVAALGLAGCGGGSGASGPTDSSTATSRPTATKSETATATETETVTKTETATETQTVTETERPTPDWIPGDREIIPVREPYRIGSIEFEVSWWEYSGDIRYFDREAEKYRQLEPTEPEYVWLNIDFEVKNLGEEKIPYPNTSDFPLIINNQTYTPVNTLPRDVTADQIYDESEEVSIGTTGWLGSARYGLYASTTGYATLLYSVPEPESVGYLKFAPAEVYEGVDHNPIYFEIMF